MEAFETQASLEDSRFVLASLEDKSDADILEELAMRVRRLQLASSFRCQQRWKASHGLGLCPAVATKSTALPPGARWSMPSRAASVCVLAAAKFVALGSQASLRRSRADPLQPRHGQRSQSGAGQQRTGGGLESRAGSSGRVHGNDGPSRAPSPQRLAVPGRSDVAHTEAGTHSAMAAGHATGGPIKADDAWGGGAHAAAADADGRAWPPHADDRLRDAGQGG